MSEKKGKTKSQKQTADNITKIRKRDGRIADFDKEKIVDAIFKAGFSTEEYNYRIAKRLATKVVNALKRKFKKDDIPNVEDIQDAVENCLIASEYHDTAKAYILYRDQHAKLRDAVKKVDSHELMEGYLNQLDWRVKENANMAFSLQGLNIHVSSAISTQYWLDEVYTNTIKRAHLDGDMHIHDLQQLSAYCCGWDLKDLLVKGFRGVSGKIESKPPKHFRPALGQIVNFFYTMQGEVAGAQALANVDTYLAPFIYYDKLTYKEVRQAMQEFIYNMNVPTRVGFQTPFTNITLDLNPSKSIAKDNVIIGGEVKDKKYGDFQEEMNMFNQAFAEVMMEGDASGRVFTFPIPTYNITKNFDWNNPINKTIFMMASKYGIPYFSNFINSDMDPDDARSMCCRLRLDNRELRSRGGGLFGANPLTGSIGVVTINLPRIGYTAKSKKDYFKKLTRVMEIAKESLATKRKMLDRLTDKGLYPYCRYYLQGIKKQFGTYWKNHFSTIGINGLNESLINFIGKDITTKEGHKLAEEILEFMREKIRDYQIETDDLFNLEATPGEGTSYRLARLDKKRYEDIIVANQEAVEQRDAEPYYTNSSHLPVGFTDDVFEALDLQDSLQTKYTGGTVLHGFIGEQIEDPEVAKELVKKIAENYKLPYFTITPTFSICPKHGYIAGEHFYCPKCDEEIGYTPAIDKKRQKTVKK